MAGCQEVSATARISRRTPSSIGKDTEKAQPMSRAALDEVVRGKGGVAPHEDRGPSALLAACAHLLGDLKKGLGEEPDGVGGGVGTGVTRAKLPVKRLLGGVQVAEVRR